eukprot:15326965-Ditylum_brightwellii.AAC.1
MHKEPREQSAFCTEPTSTAGQAKNLNVNCPKGNLEARREFPKGNPESKVTRKQEGNLPKGNPESRKIQNG